MQRARLALLYLPPEAAAALRRAQKRRPQRRGRERPAGRARGAGDPPGPGPPGGRRPGARRPPGPAPPRSPFPLPGAPPGPRGERGRRGETGPGGLFLAAFPPALLGLKAAPPPCPDFFRGPNFCSPPLGGRTARRGGGGVGRNLNKRNQKLMTFKWMIGAGSCLELAITVLATINDPWNKFAIDSPAVER